MMASERDVSVEIAPGQFKKPSDCTRTEIEAAMELGPGAKIERAIAKEEAAGRAPDRDVIARRVGMQSTEAERELIARWALLKLIEKRQTKLRLVAEDRYPDEDFNALWPRLSDDERSAISDEATRRWPKNDTPI